MFHPTHCWLSELSAAHHNFLTSVSCGGGSKKSKCTRSSIPRAFNVSTAFPKLMRWISGIVLSSNSCLYAQAVYKRKHLPAATRPARPARWFAEAWKSKCFTVQCYIHKKNEEEHAVLQSHDCYPHVVQKVRFKIPNWYSNFWAVFCLFVVLLSVAHTKIMNKKGDTKKQLQQFWSFHSFVMKDSSP